MVARRSDLKCGETEKGKRETGSSHLHGYGDYVASGLGEDEKRVEEGGTLTAFPQGKERDQCEALHWSDPGQFVSGGTII